VFFNLFSIVYTGTIPLIAWKILEILDRSPTPQPTLQSPNQPNPNPQSGKEKTYSQRSD
jgi:hypothetical protein